MRMLIFRTLIAFLCGILLSNSFLAQEQESTPVARKVFEMTNLPTVGNDDYKFYLIDFRKQVWDKEPNSQVYVIAYNGKAVSSRRPRYYIRYYLDAVKNDLNFMEGIPLDKIVVVNGGYREKAVAELWIVPKGASIPKPTPTFYPKRIKKH